MRSMLLASTAWRRRRERARRASVPADCHRGHSQVSAAWAAISRSTALIDAVRSLAPGFIFTTSLPPAITAAALTSVRYVKEHEELRERLGEERRMPAETAVEGERPACDAELLPYRARHGWVSGPRKRDDRQANVRAWDLRSTDNYPTVPRGSERLRLTPSPAHTNELIDELVSALARSMG